MTQSHLKTLLLARITPEELTHLKTNSPALILSSFNREKLLEMRDFPAQEKEISPEKVKALHLALRDYLNVYMIDQPEAHKWIILTCLYLAFVKGEPLHPKEIAGYIERNDCGKRVWFCPLREGGEGSICSYCVCRKLEN